MTTNDLAAGYYRKCGDRLAALEVLHARAAFSDVVRESQEVVELALKGMLRWAGIDLPKIRDVGGLLLEFARRFDDVSRQELTALADASKELRTGTGVQLLRQHRLHSDRKIGGGGRGRLLHFNWPSRASWWK